MLEIISNINQAIAKASKMEAWKYTKLYDLKADDYVCEKKQKITSFSKLPFAAYIIEFFNGNLVSSPKNLQEIEILPLTKAPTYILGKLINVVHYPFAELNNNSIKQGVFIRVRKNAKLDRPILLINKTETTENIFYNIHNLIVIEENAEAEFVEDYVYEGDIKSRYFSNIINEIYVEKNAKLNHVKVQDEAYKANHIALNAVSVKSSGTYDNFCLQIGANIARNETKVILEEERAATKINNAYIMNGWATIDTTTLIEHRSPYTFSDQLIKGVVGGEAKGVFQGKIHIAKDAIKTEGNQLHKALLLSDMAEVDVKPELEIFADDVKCSHGAATGVLDEMQLFYMCSRGINREEAKQMLIDAYLDDVLIKISNNALYSWVKSRIK